MCSSKILAPQPTELSVYYSPGAESKIRLLRVHGTPLVERRQLIFREERLFRNMNQVDVAKNIQGI